MDATTAFKQYIQKAGITPPDDLIPDGKIHRFYEAGDKPGTKNGSYILHDGAFPHGYCKSWKSGIEVHWSAKDEKTMTPEQYSVYLAQVAEQRKQVEKENKLRHAEARIKANSIWNNAKPAPEDHPYLVKKNVKPYGIKQDSGNLIIPVIKGDDIVGLQIIHPDGAKRFLTGTDKKGACYMIDKPTSIRFQ